MRWKMKGIAASLLLVLFVIITSCSEASMPLAEETDRLSLEIYENSYRDLQQFRNEYIYWFEREHSEIEFEVIPNEVDYLTVKRHVASPLDNRLEELKQWVETTEADVLVMQYGDYELLLSEDAHGLTPLNPWITQSDWELKDLTPAAREALMDTDRQLYGLTPTYGNAALIYNVDLFQKAGVPVPEDLMSWEELFALAKSLPAAIDNQRIHRLSFIPELRLNSHYVFFNMYAVSRELPLYNEHGELIVTDDWRSAWTQMSELHRERIIPRQEVLDQLPGDPFHFFNGDVAMSLIDHASLNQYLQTLDISFAWDLAIAPLRAVHAGNTTQEYVFAIRAGAPNSYNAWEFIDFMLSEEWHKMHGGPDKLSTREDLWPQIVDYDLSVFASFEPVKYPAILGESIIDGRIRSSAFIIWERHLNGQLTVDEALTEWEQAGNERLQDHTRRFERQMP